MEQYIMPGSAYRKLRAAKSLGQIAYIYGATGYGKTAFVQKYFGKRRYAYFDCGDRRWGRDDLPCSGTVVLDGLHRLDETRQELVRELINRPDIWLIFISRSPVPAWLMPEYVNVGFMMIHESDLHLGKHEIAGYLDGMGIAYTAKGLECLTRSEERRVGKECT